MKKKLLLLLGCILFGPALCAADECIKGDCVNGYGKMIIPQGYEFEGNWKDEKPHGKVTAKTPYGTVIKGDNWVEGALQGQGTETYANGRKYVGEFKNTKYHGIGTDSYPDGKSYTGEFANGHPHGKGVLTNADGSVYKGDFFEGHPHGKGKYTYPEGTWYEGEVRNGGPHGYGEYYGEDGEKLFAGQWVDGEEVRNEPLPQ